MKCLVVINSVSGSVPENSAEKLEADLNDLGLEYEIRLVDGNSLKDQMKEANKTLGAEDVLIVWGGDGTLACALEHQDDTSPHMLPLPGGTMNMLHERVHGDAVNSEALLKQCLTSGTRTTLPAGKINGRRFYVGAFFGKLTQLAKAREAGRHGHPFKALETFVSASDILDLTPELSITTDVSTACKANTLGVFLEEGLPDKFDVGIFASESFLDLTSAAIESLAVDWREADGVTHTQCKTLNIACDADHPVYVTLDGELEEFTCPIDITFKPDAARVLSAKS